MPGRPRSLGRPPCGRGGDGPGWRASRSSPSSARAILTTAIDRVSAATGLSLVVDGPTDEVASVDRPNTDQARYGTGWSPVLVAWTNPNRIAQLDGRVAGTGGSRYVTGTVYLDGPDLQHVLNRRRGTSEVTAIVMHELGHVVGLAHVEDRTQLMNEDNVGRTAFGAGDLRGLARLGDGPCEREF